MDKIQSNISTAQINDNVESNEQLDKFISTRDICSYLDILDLFKNKYLIILSVKDTPGVRMPSSVVESFKNIGFCNFTTEHLRNYIGVINKGIVLYDCINEKAGDPMLLSLEIGDMNITIKSESYPKGNSEIRIYGEDYSMNSRGINIVVYDPFSKKVIDSSTYDSWLPKATFYHKNLEFNDDYFSHHIFVPEMYEFIWRFPLYKKYYSDRTLDAQEVDNGVILPIKEMNGQTLGGVTDEHYKFISGCYNFSHNGKMSDRCIYDSYTPDVELKKIDETVIWGGLQFGHPGHLILEGLANWLWFLNKNNDYKIAVIFKWGHNAFFFEETMEAIGIPKERIIVITKPTKFKKVIIPDQSAIMYYQAIPYEFTKEWASFFEHFRNYLTPGKYKKVYLTKAKTKHGNIIGEQYFIEFFRNHGFTIIDPEDYSMKEKAEIMRGADEVVTVIGTNDLFTIFCKPSVKITLLTRQDSNSYGVDSMNFIREAAGIKEIYIVNVSAGFLHKYFVFGLIPLYATEDFKKYVKEYFNEQIDVDSEKTLKDITFEYLRFAPEYYSNPHFFNYLKNQKMLTVLQNISELFNNRKLDITNLDIVTNEEVLKKQNEELLKKNKFLSDQIKSLSDDKVKLTSENKKLLKEKQDLQVAKKQTEDELIEAYRCLFESSAT